MVTAKAKAGLHHKLFSASAEQTTQRKLLEKVTGESVDCRNGPSELKNPCACTQRSEVCKMRHKRRLSHETKLCSHTVLSVVK